MQGRTTLLLVSLAPSLAAALPQSGSAPIASAPERLSTSLAEVIRNTHGVHEEEGRVHGYGYGYRVVFGEGGIDFLADGSPALGMSFAAVSRGEQTVRVAEAEAPRPDVDGKRVSYDHGGGLLERYEVGVDDVELSFVFAERPAGEGDLVVQLALETELRAETYTQSAGLRFLADGHPEERGVRIGGVLGIDAEGEQAAGSLRLDEATLELVLPHAFVEEAAYPLVLDPLIGSLFVLSGGTSIAYDETHQTWLAAWRSGDLHTALFSEDMALVEQMILNLADEPVSGEGGIHVANVNATDRFLVVFSGAEDPKILGVRAVSVDAQTGGLVGSLTFASSGSDRVRVTGDPRPGSDDVILVYQSGFGGSSTAAVVEVPSAGSPFPITTVALALSGSGSLGLQVCKGMGQEGATLIVGEIGNDLVGRVFRSDGTLGPTAVLATGSGAGWASYAVDGDGTRFVVAFAEPSGPLSFLEVDYDSGGGTLTPGTIHQVSGTAVSTLQGESIATGFLPDAQLISFRDTNDDVYAVSVDPENGDVCEPPTLLTTGSSIQSKIATKLSATDPASPAAAQATEAMIAYGNQAQAWTTDQPSSEVVRNSFFVPNTALLLPGQTSGPVVGQTWDPLILPTGGDTWIVPGMTIGRDPFDIPGIVQPPSGTLLIDPTPPIIVLFSPGLLQTLAIPQDCTLLGVELHAQGFYYRTSPAPAAWQLTTALDFVFGNQ